MAAFQASRPEWRYPLFLFLFPPSPGSFLGLLLCLLKAFLVSSQTWFPRLPWHTCTTESPAQTLNGSRPHFQFPSRWQPLGVPRHSHIPSSGDHYAYPIPAPPQFPHPSSQKPGPMLGSPSLPPPNNLFQVLEEGLTCLLHPPPLPWPSAATTLPHSLLSASSTRLSIRFLWPYQLPNPHPNQNFLGWGPAR